MKRCLGFRKLIGALAPAASGMAPRRMFKAAAVLITLGYCSLLVYQGGVTFNFQESRAGSVQVSDLSIEPVRTTVYDSVHKNITLDDIFISVKTSKHYQYSRLPIILKTWFQLAKDQVRILNTLIEELTIRTVSFDGIN